MIFMILIALVGASRLITDHFPTPLYLETPQGQRINLQEHLILPEVPLYNLWRFRFALPIFLQVYPGSLLKTTADYDQAMLSQVNPAFRLHTLNQPLQLPFGNIPKDKLLEAEQPMLQNWPEIDALLRQPPSYEHNPKFREMVDKYGLLQLLCNLEDWLSSIEGETELFPTLQGGVGILDSWAYMVSFGSGSPQPNPFYAALVWEPCNRYRSPVRQIECWAKVDTTSTTIPAILKEPLNSAGLHLASCFHLSLEASRRLLALRDSTTRYVVIMHGHPDSFIGSADLASDSGVTSEEIRELFISTDFGKMIHFVLNREALGSELTFIVRRLVELLSNTQQRTAEMEEAFISAVASKAFFFWPLIYRFRPLHPRQPIQGDGKYRLWPLYEAAALLAPDTEAAWVDLRPQKDATWVFNPMNLLVLAHWNVPLPSPDDWKPHVRALTALSTSNGITDAHHREMLYAAAIKSAWHPYAITQLMLSLADKGHGLPDEFVLPSPPELLLPHLLLVDPRPLVKLVHEHGWNWLMFDLSNPIKLRMAQVPLAQKTQIRAHLASLLARSVVIAPALVERMQDLLTFSAPNGSSPISFDAFWFQVETDLTLINLRNLRRVLPEPSLMPIQLRHSPRIGSVACDLADRLLAEMSDPSQKLTQIDNFAIRLAMVWLPAVEKSDARLKTFLDRIKSQSSWSTYAFSYFSSRFNPPPALKRQYQMLPDHLHLIMAHRQPQEPAQVPPATPRVPVERKEEVRGRGALKDGRAEQPRRSGERDQAEPRNVRDQNAGSGRKRGRDPQDTGRDAQATQNATTRGNQDAGRQTQHDTGRREPVRAAEAERPVKRTRKEGALSFFGIGW